MVKNLPANAGRRPKKFRFHPWVRKIPLDEGMSTHFNILVWIIPWTEEPGRLQFCCCLFASVVSASGYKVAKNHTTEATEHACPMRSRIMVCRKGGGNIFLPSNGLGHILWFCSWFYT